MFRLVIKLYNTSTFVKEVVMVFLRHRKFGVFIVLIGYTLISSSAVFYFSLNHFLNILSDHVLINAREFSACSEPLLKVRKSVTLSFGNYEWIDQLILWWMCGGIFLAIGLWIIRGCSRSRRG